MPGVPEGYEPHAKALGKLLRSARGRRRQRDIEQAVGVSDSSLSRFERGQSIPDIEIAAKLDEVLRLDGKVSEQVRAILFPAGTVPIPVGRRLIVAVFPPDYLGAVYVHLRTAAGQRAAVVQVTLIWGDWWCRHTLMLDATGVALQFAKVEAAKRSVPLRVQTSHPVAATYGLDMPAELPDQRIIDANDGWALRSQEIPRAHDER
ncbi:helix-turn-helix transcriptional regulator [Micromonospora sp. HM134]|uniref:helix-turn-helix domain-containing protein n=1 Tax=Micromonospora sp. HM134 TaxID=2583243 RepID=UPI001198AA82|nr:helix-turn-helix transcriptional regulator [Micromonospora sp. HM134]QDY11194.1 helix-turn-helix transcriptional regulator [Micromonospora sp. HM134]